MSISLYVEGYAGKNSPEFQKHAKAVKFCIENELSFPKETSKFFEDKNEEGCKLEDYTDDYILQYIENGIKINLKLEVDDDYKKVINVKDIPPECEQIIITIE